MNMASGPDPAIRPERPFKDPRKLMKQMMIAGCCMLMALCAFAQDGAPAGTMKKAESAPAAKPEPLDPQAEAWIQVLAKRIADAQPIVRDSAIAGLEKVGKPALATLNKLASDPDKALAEAAKKLAERINRGPQPGEGRGAAQFGADRVDTLAKELKLDDQKTQKLKDLQKAAMDRMREGMDAMRNGDLTGEEFREEMKQYREEAGKELRKFLSEEEAKKVEESLLRSPGGRRGGGQGGGEGGGGQGGGGMRRRQGGGGQ
jgi:hypothetical protein